MKKLITILILILSLLFSVNAVDLNDTENYYSFNNDDTIGSIAVDSANNYNGTLNNIVTGVEIVSTLGEAYQFNGASSYVNINSSDTPPNNVSMSAWVNLTTVAAGTTNTIGGWIDSGGNEYRYGYIVSGKLRWSMSPSFGNYRHFQADNFTAVANQTYHIVITQQGTNNPIFYINGSAHTTSTVGSGGTTGLPTNVPLNIGYAANPGTYLYGKIDEVGFWNGILTSSQVSELYNNGNGYNPYIGDILIQDATVNGVSLVDNLVLNTSNLEYNFQLLNVTTNSNINTSYSLNGVDYTQFGYNTLKPNVSLSLTPSNTNIYFKFENNESSRVITYSMLINITLTMKMYSFSNPATQLYFNTTILNDSTSTTFKNQYNFVQNYNNLTTGDIEILVSSNGHSQSKFYNTLSPSTSITVTGYLFNSSVVDIVNFDVLEYGSSTPLVGVDLEAQYLISGSWTTIAQAQTTDTGSTYMFLDVSKEYRILLSKDGYLSSTLSTTPGTTDYTIRLKSAGTLYEYVDGINYGFSPTSSALYLNNNYTFNGIISGSSISQTTYSLITNNGTVLYSSTSTNPTGTTYSYYYDLGNTSTYTSLTATITYTVDGVTTTRTKLYSIFGSSNAIQAAKDFGGETDEESKLFRFLVILAVEVGALILGRAFAISISYFPVIALIPLTGFMMIDWLSIIYWGIAVIVGGILYLGGTNK